MLRILILLTLNIALITSSAAPVMAAAKAESKHQQNNKRAHKKSTKKPAKNIKAAVPASPVAKLSAIKDPLTPAIINWWHYRDGDPTARFEEIAKFIETHSTWPDQSLLQKRAEESITLTTSNPDLREFFQTREPATSKGKWAYARALLALNAADEKAPTLLRDAWAEGNWGADERAQFLENHKSVLREEDHARRTDRLLWEDRLNDARDMLSFLNESHRKLFSVRMQLMRSNGGNPDALLSEVPESLRSDPGLLYERLRFRERRGRDLEMVSLLPGAPDQVLVHADQWWEMKHALARRLIENEHFKEAHRVASNHGSEPGSIAFADAEWLAGWIALRFLNDPQQAYTHFYRLYHNVQFAVSLARGAYWAGRAAEANQNPDIAKEWFTIAARYPSTFYGQLALIKLGRDIFSAFPPPPDYTAEEQKSVQRNTLLHAARLLEQAQQSAYAKRFVKAAIQAANTPGEMLLITEFGSKIGKPELSVEAAKESLRREVTLVPQGYPKLSNVPHEPLEVPLALAIIRQESMFNPSAASPAGAKGLMQLMPATAVSVAKKNDIRAPLPQLQTSPQLNMRVGTLYLGSLINHFNGSYVLAIAAYNGGQGNVAKWQSRFGRFNPRTPEEAVDWIEMIPFSETRTYVQRVLENLQIYRSMFPNPKGSLTEDLTRSS